MVEFGMKKLYDAADRLENLEKSLKTELDKASKITKMALLISIIALGISIAGLIPLFLTK